MGAANPLAAGEAVLRVARELGLARLRVAVVLGDQLGRELEVEIAEGVDAFGVGNLRHALEGRTDPFQVK
jgi:hypothetical protein